MRENNITLQPKGKNKYGVLAYKYIGFISLLFLPLTYYQFVCYLYNEKIIPDDYAMIYAVVIGISVTIFISLAILSKYYKYANRIYVFSNNELIMYTILNKGTEEFNAIEKDARQNGHLFHQDKEITNYGRYTVFATLVSFIKTLYYDQAIYNAMIKDNCIENDNLLKTYNYKMAIYKNVSIIKSNKKITILAGTTNNNVREKIKIYNAYTNIDNLISSIK
mgnify:CR=1 FL=1